MRGGALRHPIVIEETTESRDAVGSVVDSWATFASVRAEINPSMGKEYFDSARLNAENAAVFRIRYLSGLKTKMRITFDSRTFEIESFIDTRERNREMLVLTTEETQ